MGALLAGASIGVPSAEAREQLGLAELVPPLETAAAAVATPLYLGVAADYRFGLWSTGAPRTVHGPGLSTSVVAGDRFRWGARAGIAARFSRVVETTDLQAKFSEFVMRVLAMVEYHTSSGPIVEVAVGPGLDLAFVSTESPGGGTDTRDPTIVDPVVTLQAGAAIAIAPRGRMALRATLDVDLESTKYVVASPGGIETVIDPLPLRPGLQLSLGFWTN